MPKAAGSPKATRPKAPAKPRAKPKAERPTEDKREIFIRRYLIHKNASRAYVEAGYQDGPGTRQSAHRLLTSAYVQGRLAEEQAEILRTLDVEVATVFSRLRDMAFADATQVTSYHVGACRYCHGKDHRYHWRTPREYEAALAEAIRESDKTGKHVALPDNAGGYGFSAKLPANPECPECDGYGVPQPVFKDTRLMTDAEKALFAGVEVTERGLKFKINDQVAALNRLGTELGMFKTQHEHAGKGGGPIEHEVTARVIIVPAKEAAKTEVRPMPDEDEDEGGA